MLIQFRVKNFTSYKDEACLSMIANSGKENADNYSFVCNENILKCASIYGANASGKTNLLKAFTASIRFIRESFIIPPIAKLEYMDSFVFDDETINNPCEFEYIFEINNKKYVYGFSATKDKVIDEYLDVYNSSRATEIFLRKNTNEYKFTKEDERELKNYQNFAVDNRLFLSVLGNSRYEKAIDPFRWFLELIDTYNGGLEYNFASPNYSFNSYEKDENGELKKFALELLNGADIQIKDYNFESKETNANNILFPNSQVPLKPIKITMTHTTNVNGKKKDYDLDFFKSESSGTKILFMLAPVLKNAFEKGKVLYVDVLENSLHPHLLDAVIKMFNNPKLNKGNAQLIINTHNVHLLSLNKFRRDQIWFVEKNPETGGSELYSLADFSVRKEENIQKGYLLGRYGAVPFIQLGDDDFC